MNRTLKVDFAGSKVEARIFVEQHKGEFPRGLTMGRGGAERSPNGDFMLFAKYRSSVERDKIVATFARLGWGVGECS